MCGSIVITNTSKPAESTACHELCHGKVEYCLVEDLKHQWSGSVTTLYTYLTLTTRLMSKPQSTLPISLRDIASTNIEIQANFSLLLIIITSHKKSIHSSTKLVMMLRRFFTHFLRICCIFDQLAHDQRDDNILKTPDETNRSESFEGLSENIQGPHGI